jgi:branched-chain amino acid transport system permease protein
MKTTLRQSFFSGFVFGVIHVFLILIGFNTLIGTLLTRLVGLKFSGDFPPVGSLVVYTALLALLGGWAAARKSKAATLASNLAAGAAAGLLTGLIAFLLDLGLGWLLTNKVDFRQYLAYLSFDFIRATLFQLTPLTGALATLGLFLGSGVLGGLLRGLRSVAVVEKLGASLRRFKESVGARLSDILHGRYKLVSRILLFALLAAAVVFLPLKWGSYWNYVTGTVGLYVILGLGLNLIVGLSGQLVLGYIAFFAIGAYTMALLNSPIPHNIMLGFWPAVVLGVLLAALAGLLLGLPLMRLRGDYLAIVTLGFGEIIRILLKSDALTDITGGPRGIQNISGPRLFGIQFNSDIHFTYLILAAALLAAFVYHRLERSRAGRAWLAIREDETVARATGVNTTKYKLLALALGAAFAGLAGAIYASRNQFTGPEEHSLMASINVLSLIIVGGMGNIPGTILGAFALKGLPEILREFANYRLLTFGALLVVMMLSRPDGLIPTRRPKYPVPPPDKVEEPGGEVNDER